MWRNVWFIHRYCKRNWRWFLIWSWRFEAGAGVFISILLPYLSDFTALGQKISTPVTLSDYRGLISRNRRWMSNYMKHKVRCTLILSFLVKCPVLSFACVYIYNFLSFYCNLLCCNVTKAAAMWRVLQCVCHAASRGPSKYTVGCPRVSVYSYS